MKIKGTNLMVSVEHDIKIGNNDAIEATVVHQVMCFESKRKRSGGSRNWVLWYF